MKKNRQGLRQISFYCEESFWNTIQAEKVRRGMTIQSMATEALLDFFARPSEQDIEEHRKQEVRVAKKLEETGRVSWDELPPRFELHRWIDLCVRYHQRMPKAKKQILEEFIILDLKHYASSRLKRKD